MALIHLFYLIISVILLGNIGATLIGKLYPNEQFTRVIFQIMWWFMMIFSPTLFI